MTKTFALAIATALGFGGMCGSIPFLVPAPPNTREIVDIRPVWTEAQWPFPIDQWGRGHAYNCKAADCGGEVNLYLRAKIGFCNCSTGVADDEELDRVSDVDLIGNPNAAAAPGRSITVAWMRGRSRPMVRRRTSPW